jgi:hypothetical protein
MWLEGDEVSFRKFWISGCLLWRLWQFRLARKGDLVDWISCLRDGMSKKDEEILGWKSGMTESELLLIWLGKDWDRQVA